MRAVAERADTGCYMALYDHFMPRLCLYLRGLGAPPEIAEELAQEALLRLWQRAREYDPALGAVSTWLFRIARNMDIDRRRREAGRLAVAEADGWPEPAASDRRDPPAHADHASLRRRIDALSPVQARLVRMSYFEARSHQEIATELAMPLGTVKSHLRRAFQRLQGELGEQP